MPDKSKRNFSRTIAALAEYDELDAKGAADGRLRLTEGHWNRLEDLGEAVGKAYGLDTADINSIDTCRKHVRPGPKTPASGHEISFVRRMVRDHHDPKVKRVRERTRGRKFKT